MIHNQWTQYEKKKKESELYNCDFCPVYYFKEKGILIALNIFLLYLFNYYFLNLKRFKMLNLTDLIIPYPKSINA